MQNYSYHTHTTYSDGRNTAEEMIQQAVKLGLKEFGISDHLTVHKNFQLSPSWPKLQKLNASFIYRYDFAEAKEFFKRYVDEVREIGSRYPLKLYLGAEVDYFPYDGWLDEFNDFREQVGLDFCITGNHFLLQDKGEFIFYPNDIAEIVTDLGAQKECLRYHFQTIMEAVKSGLFDFVAHLDYMRRLNICGDDDFVEEKKALIKCLADNHVPAELSTKGLRISGKYFPVSWMVQEMKKNNVQVVISDDAHQTSQIAQNFEEAETYLAEMNYTNRWKLL